LLLGGGLAHFFGGSKNPVPVAVTETSSPLPTVTPAVAFPPARRFTPVPEPSASATPASRPRPSPRSSPTPEATPAATPTAAAPAATATPVATATPHVVATPVTPRPVVASKPAEDRASALVRQYLVALAGNDRAAASAYLARGTPTETFMADDAHIESIRSVKAGPQQYRVGADVQTTSGEYYVTFTVEAGPGGLQITDHYTVKPQ
jgi:hypothetical protein